MYKNHVESLRESGDCKNNLQEKIGNITAQRNSFKKVQCYQYLNKDIQHRSNKDPTQKLNVANEVLATKEDSGYHLTRKYSCLHIQLEVETISHLLSPLRQYEGQAHNKYSSTTWCSKYSSNPTAYFITIRFTH